MFVTSLLKQMGALEGEGAAAAAAGGNQLSLSEQLKNAQRDTTNKQESKVRSDYSKTLERIARLRTELEDFAKVNDSVVHHIL